MLPETDHPRSDYLRHAWLLAAVVVFGVLIYLLSPILAPFLTAAIFAYICDPLVDRLQRRGVPRTLGVLLVLLMLFMAVLLLLVILLPIFYKEIAVLADRVPDFIARLKTDFGPWLERNFGIELQFDAKTIRKTITENWQEAGGIAGRVWSSLKIGGLALIGFFVNLILIPVVLFYLLRDWDQLVAKVNEMVPLRWRSRVSTIARDIDAVLAEFLRGQLSVMLLMALYYTVGLWITGLEFFLPIGIITGLMVFVPFLGSIIGLVLSTLAAAMQFTSIGGIVPVWIVFTIGQLLEGYVVTPWLVGDRIGLHPVAVIFALLAFGQLFGFVGVLLALPLAAALLVGLRHVRASYVQSAAFND